MSYKDFNSYEAIIHAIQEYRSLGREEYLIRYRGKATASNSFTYFVCYEGLLYECKPIFLGAYFHQFGKHLENTSTSGVKGSIKPILESLGFSVYSGVDSEVPEDIAELIAEQPKRAPIFVNRIIRNSQIAEDIKELYGHKCQICNEVLETPKGFYAEGAHIKPLGSPHHGPDTKENLLCLCPNHHALFDKKAIVIHDDYTVDFITCPQGKEIKLTVHVEHKIDQALVKYHREEV
ncbi:HNH endonuclease [Pseudoalteromonas sp. Z9A5]|uniref:HNH endonuclease n=1 Tax=Pseudoalteromonas sp. Z9A5 TaxID=2686355 RepID=UPI0014096FF0|nr:HNH endonuclease [Pseudoalteromonas sp. Z9A5]